MMRDKKTVFRVFTVPQYRQEEDFLSKMHEEGWSFTDVSYPGFYHFIKTDPDKFSYRLDFNSDGIKNHDEYIRLFSDCGWEHLCEFAGYSYFRKQGAEGEDSEDIFCDDASRLDMMNRVFKARIVPLIIIFTAVILPQLMNNTIGSMRDSLTGDVFSFIFLGMAILYLTLFAVTAVQYYRYEKKVSPGTLRTDIKYGSIFVLIFLLVAGIGAFIWMSYHSSYRVSENPTGYVLEADRLNTSVSREYDLKQGDTVVFHVASHERGKVHLSIREEGKDPVFFADLYNICYESYEIQKDGHYVLGVSGWKLTGSVDVIIR